MYLLQGEYQKAIEKYESMVGETYFEFDLSYVPLDERFREIDRFLWESRHQMTRFENRYKGEVLVNLTAWHDRFPNEYLTAFFYFLKGNQDAIKVTFLSEQKCERYLMSALETFFEVETVELNISKEIQHTFTLGFANEMEMV